MFISYNVYHVHHLGMAWQHLQISAAKLMGMSLGLKAHMHQPKYYQGQTKDLFWGGLDLMARTCKDHTEKPEAANRPMNLIIRDHAALNRLTNN